MTRAKVKLVLPLAAIFTLGFWFGRNVGTIQSASADAQQKTHVFEIRTYTTEDGKLDALHARFRDHTIQLFKNHGITSVGYWTPEDAPLSQNTLIYLLSHPSREAAKKNWAEFGNDPEWLKARSESEANGKIVRKVESVFVDATDHSPMK